MSIYKNILVTGSNRSGSTWVGRVISANKKVDNIIEPLNLNRIRRFKTIELDFWYPKIVDDSPSYLKNNIKGLYEFYLNTSYSWVFTQLFRSYEGHDLMRSFKKRWRRAGKPIKLLKDPTAIFSVPWLVKEFNLIPVILIRHPAAFVLSVKEKNWWFDFDNLLNQQDFFNGEMGLLFEEVMNFKKKENEMDIVENASLMWKVFYTQVLEYQKNYPNWYYISHEKLSNNPIIEFKKMFDYLNIEFSTDVENYLIDSTQSKISSEHRRNSKENAKKWMKKLSDKEKETVFNWTTPVAEVFYDKFV